MKVVLLNMSDDRNKGDLAILESTVGFLRKKYPESSLSLFNIDYSDREVDRPGSFRNLEGLKLEAHYGSFFPRVFAGGGQAASLFRAGLNLLRCLWVSAALFIFRGSSPAFLAETDRAKVKELLGADLVIVKGGGYLYSFGGLAQLLYLARHLFPVLLALRLKKKVLALGHSIGPFNGKAARGIARSILKRTDRIVVRDTPSFNLLRDELGLDPAGVLLLPDLAFRRGPGEEKPSSTLKTILEREGVGEVLPPDRPKVGITVREFRRWHFPESPDPNRLFADYLQTLGRAVGYLEERYGARVIIMPHAREDGAAGAKLREAAGKSAPLLLEGDYPTSSLRRLYGEMDLFIATRIHSALFALGEGVPTLAIGYEMPKAYGIVGMAWNEGAVFDVRTLTFNKLQESIDRVMASPASFRGEIGKKVGRLRQVLEEGLDRVFDSV